MVGESAVIRNFNSLMDKLKIANRDEFDEDLYKSFDSYKDNIVVAFNKYSYLSYFAMNEIKKEGETINTSKLNNYYRKFKDLSEKCNVESLVLSGLPIGCCTIFEAITAFNKGCNARAYHSKSDKE